MKIILTLSLALTLVSLMACGGGPANTPPAVPAPNVVSNTSPSTLPTALPTPKNGNYPGKGKVLAVNKTDGSVELDHEAINGVMPAMKMAFYVTTKPMLDKLAVGDKVDFTLEYADGKETIIKIDKAQ